MQTTGGLSLGGITITPPPAPAAPTFSTFGGAYVTNAPQNDTTFGNYTAMNYDGTVFVAGAPNLNKVYVYSRSGTTWSLLQTITGTGYFGVAVSLSSDGLTLFVGNQSGTGKIYTRANTGASFSSVFNTSATRVDLLDLSYDATAFVYPDTTMSLKLGKNTSGTWSEIATYAITSTSNSFPLVTMNSDGTRLAYSKVFETVSGNTSAGQVKILSWDRTSTSPTLVQTINDPNPAVQNRFGHSLDMSSNGDTLVLNSLYNGNAGGIGAAYVYKWNGSQYNLEQSFIGSVNQDYFGCSSAREGDVLILTKNTTPNSFLAYTRTGSTWSLQQTTTLPTGFENLLFDGATGGNNNRTSISGDGNHFIAVEPTGTSRFVYYTQGG